MERQILRAIEQGKILIYPTDTIYGIGTDATNSASVRRLRRLKKSQKPFSVIVSKGWIRKNCIVPKMADRYVKKLPGPYTLIFRLKNKRAVNKETNLGRETIGVRIPKHPFITTILKAKRPFITTSVNESGRRFMTSVKDIPKRFKSSAIIIDAGRLKGKPSKIYDLTAEKARRVR